MQPDHRPTAAPDDVTAGDPAGDLAGELAALVAGDPSAAPEPSLLAARPDGTVVRVGDAVAKAHAPDADLRDLAVRLRVAADRALDGVLLAPLPPARAVRLADGRAATTWPYGVPVDPGAPEAAPWGQAGALLARLHTVPLGALRRRHGPLPAMRGPAKSAAAMERMRAAVRPLAVAGGALPAPRTGSAAARLRAARCTVENAWASLPAWCRGEDEPPADRHRALCHGDFHLGQLVRGPVPPGRWRLIDIDDLGVGDPAWDLARPAAWYATGLLPPAAWERLLAGYRRHRAGPAEDPWPWLDHPARTLTVQTAALAVEKAAQGGRMPDEDEEALLAACSRIVELPGPVRP